MRAEFHPVGDLHSGPSSACMTSQSLESNFDLSRTISVFVMPDTSTDPPNTIVRLGEKRGVEEKVMFGLEIIAAGLTGRLFHRVGNSVGCSRLQWA